MTQLAQTATHPLPVNRRITISLMGYHVLWSGFYIRYRLTQSVEPWLLDETDWRYVEALE